ELAEKLNISQQQVRKYESGQDRVSAGRLAQIADSLGVPVAAFYALEPCRFHKLERISLELNRAFLSIPNRQVQRFIVLMVKGVAAKYPLFLEEETRQKEQFHA